MTAPTRQRLRGLFQPKVGGSLGDLCDLDHAAEVVRAYHERTKHHLQGYALGPDTLDWDAQPDPFRTWAGAPLSMLPLMADEGSGTWAEVQAGRVSPAPLARRGVAQLLELSLGITAWKQLGPDRWALRTNPSSGNLHPTEAYVLAQGVPGLPDGLFHHDARLHALACRALGRCLPTGITHPAGPALWVGLSSVMWREAWKYGERAFRYAELDIGHAVGAVRVAAATLGWRARWWPGLSHAELAARMGLDRDADFGEAEREEPQGLLAIWPADAPPPVAPPGPWSPDTTWMGQANVLDRHPLYRWPVIDEVVQATRLARPDPLSTPAAEGGVPALAPTWPGLQPSASDIDGADAPGAAWPAARLIRGRRSAQRFDHRAVMPLAAFVRLLDAIQTRQRLPWDVWPHAPRVHAVVYAHRVDGLPAGAYLLPRGADGADPLVAALTAGQCRPVAGLPAGLALMQLAEHPALAGTVRTLSCHQAIGSDACVAFSLVADLGTPVAPDATSYRTVLQEAGLLGQALYLQAEAEGLRGTGIGCYFDDAVHELLGLRDPAWQVVYHFTVGLPLTDARLQTQAPYDDQRMALDTPFDPPVPVASV